MSTIVTLLATSPHEPFLAPLNWAKENCPSYITNDVHMYGYNSYDNSKIDYFFSEEEDAFKFALRWGNERI